MSKYFLALQALPKGLSYCLTNKAVRRLSIWPWIVGAICYFASIAGAYYLHPVLLSWLVGEPEGFWRTILFGIAWLGIALLLVVLTFLLSIIIVLLFTSVFQTAIAARVLQSLNHRTPPDEEGFKGLAADTFRSVSVEAIKLLWLLPLMALVLILGLIPPLSPIALIVAAWLLAYQFIDIVLEVYRVTAGRRLRFARKQKLLLICFGAILSLAWSIPFLGIFLPPVAAAGAAWLLSVTELIEEFESESAV